MYALYDFKIELLELETLENRRICACNFFIFDLLSGRVDASNILEMININVPSFSFRNYRFFSTMMILFNSVFEDFDFTVSRDSFRRTIRSRFSNVAVE